MEKSVLLIPHGVSDVVTVELFDQIHDMFHIENDVSHLVYHDSDDVYLTCRTKQFKRSIFLVSISTLVLRNKRTECVSGGEIYRHLTKKELKQIEEYERSGGILGVRSKSLLGDILSGTHTRGPISKRTITLYP